MSNALIAVSVAADLLTAVVEISAKLQQVNAVLQKARMEGRDITDEELNGIRKLDDEAKARLDLAIAKAASGA